MELSGARADFNTCGTEFLLRELALALTFMDVAAVSDNAEHAQRAHAHALAARRTILRFLPNVRPDVQRQQMIERDSARLEARMLAAGIAPATVMG